VGTIEINLLDILNILKSGVFQTLKLIPLSIIFSLIAGTLLGVIQSKKIPVLKIAISSYVIFMRGIPPLLLMMLFFFAMGIKDPFVAAFFALSIYHSGYITEIIRGGIEAIPKGQFEAGRSLGLSQSKIMSKIIIPQIWYQVIPALAGQYIILIKDTTITSVIGVREILSRGRQAMQFSVSPLQTFQIFFLIGFFFYILCGTLNKLSILAEYSLKKKFTDSRS